MRLRNQGLQVDAVTPLALRRRTARTDRVGLIQIASDEDITAGANNTKAVTPAQLPRVTVDLDIFYAGGTEETPSVINGNERIVIENPFPGYCVFCRPKVLISEQWSHPGWLTWQYNGQKASVNQLLPRDSGREWRCLWWVFKHKW